jgi:TatD DNase family protein
MTPSSRAAHVDAHVHLDKYTDRELSEVLDGIDRHRILTVSVSDDPDAYGRARCIAQQSRFVIATFGIHPWEAPRFAGTIDQFTGALDTSPMIGEIGLDHRFVTDPAAHQAQAEVFATLLDHAAERRKTVNIHSSGAEQEVAAMLRDRRVERAILHWYAGPIDVLRQLIRRDHLFTIGIEILHSDHLRQVAALIPSEQLLTETDNPVGYRWLTGHTGRHLITLVEDALAEVRGTTADRIRDRVHANLRRLVRHDPHLAPWRPLLATTGAGRPDESLST